MADNPGGREGGSKSGAGKARAAYEIEADALRAKTERLRALRLAKEEEERQRSGAEVKPARSAGKKPATAARSGKAKGSTPKLSDWLSGQSKDGRRS